MKVAEFVEKNEAVLPKELAELVNQETNIWTNDACYGYLVTALANLGFERWEIAEAVASLHGVFDEMTVEEAESVWRKW